ncbi:MAG TPA: calcium-binding protein, partial [Allosphingosinicella sp.]
DVVSLYVPTIGQTEARRITDFEAGNSGDRLEISANPAFGSDPFGSGYLRLVQAGADVLVQYDRDGASAGYGWITLITLADSDKAEFTPYNLGVPGFGGVAPPGLVLAGTAGDDSVHGAYGSDSISGGDGNDRIDGLAGNDRLVGGAGEDSVEGGAGNDVLEGGEGADTLSLGAGDDVASGGGGNDSIVVDDEGNDIVNGGDGDDYIELSRFIRNEHVVLNGDAGNDRIFINPSSIGSNGAINLQVDVDAGAGDDRVTLVSRTVSRITLGAGRDVIELDRAFPLDGSTIVTDFQAGEGGDMLDFDAWLTGFAPAIDPNSNPFLTGKMRLVQSGADVLVQIYREGSGWGTVVTLQKVDMAALRSANLDNYQLLQQHGTEGADVLDGSGLDDSLYGEGGDDTIRGFGGADILQGGEGADSIEGGEGADKIQGDSGDDVLDGGQGSDIVSGGEGSDRIGGGTERDVLHGDSGNDIVAGGDGDDDLFGDSGDDSLSGGLGADYLIGDLGDDSMDGGEGNDVLFSDAFDSAPQHDVATGGAGTDALQVDFFDILGAPGVTMTIAADPAGGHSGTISAGADYGVAFSTVETFGIAGTNQGDQITTGDGADLLVGRLGDDVLSGGGGSDWLIGDGGADTMIGGTGDDRYDVDNAADVLVENAGEGIDLVESRLASYTLLANFENLTGLLSTGQTLIGNDGANVIKAGSGNDVLDGGLGADSLSGGAGNDIYYIDNAGDTYTEFSGFDEVRTSLAVYAMGEFIELLTGISATGQTLIGTTTGNTIQGAGGDDVINGEIGNDTLYGGGGQDWLDGGSGADTMRGQLGDDVYVVDNVLDSVIEAAGEGSDKVMTALASYTLGANVESLTGTASTGQSLRGNALDNAVTGGAGGDTLLLQDGGVDKVSGNGGNDTVYFGAALTAADQANGGSDVGGDTLILQGDYSAGLTFGAATMTGFEYLHVLSRTNTRFGASSAAPNQYNLTIADANVAAGAFLTVDAGNLAANETLVFDGSAETDGRFWLVGGAGADRLTGGSGRDALQGGAGADTLIGGLGGDYYIADDSDIIVEAADGGDDRVETSSATFRLSANIETLTGTSGGSQTLIGNSGANTIEGGSGADTLDGAGGTDTLKGNGGNDILRVTAPGSVWAQGGAGADTLTIDWSAATTAIVNSFNPSFAVGPEGFDVGFSDWGAYSVSGNGIDSVDITTGSGNDNIKTGPGNDRVNLNGGDDRLDAGAGSNIADGGAGVDGLDLDLRSTTAAIVWNIAANSHSGVSGSYTNFEYFAELETGSGNDIIVTGAVDRQDFIYTYLGNDTVTVFAGSDTVITGLGVDTLIVDYSAATEAIATLGMVTTEDGMGGAFGDSGAHKVTFSGVDRFRFTGGSGNDSITTSTGDDILSGGDGDDSFVANGGNDELTGGAGNDSLQGGDGNDVLAGGIGNDSLNGGAGADSMTGGVGDDVYVIDSLGDVATELEGQGTDRISTSLATFVLGSAFEELAGSSAAGQALTGNGGDNLVSGWMGNDIIDGGAGADQMFGLGGDDVYYVDNAGDTVGEEESSGTDEVRTGLAAYSLAANVEYLTGTSGAGQALTGNASANRITGGAGKDSIDGGSGADTMIGGLGDDVYFVDNSADSVVEAFGGGSDEIRTALAVYSIAALGQVETLAGTGNFGQTLTGNAGSNRIAGGGGNDVIDGGGGADTLVGGAGDDTYLVDNAGDSVIEAPDAGNDEIRTALLAYSLAAMPAVERLTGTSALGQTLTGNALSNRITGGDGNDVLDGGAGTDTLIGGLGDDVYIVGEFDSVSETAGGGIDEARTSDGLYILYDNVEKLTGLSSAGQTLIGNGSANEIAGGSGNDMLYGRGGNDMLDGGAGADSLYGEGGDDSYRVDDSNDKVFESADSGSDTVLTTLAAYQLGANVEDLRGLLDTGQSLTGNSEINRVTGGAGDDVLNGGGGFGDNLEGNGGDDRFVVDQVAALWAYGGSGSDTLVIKQGSALGAVTMTLSAGSEGYSGRLRDSGSLDVNFDNIENFDLTTGAFDDSVLTGAGGDRLILNGGNDRAEAGGGSDFVDGGDGSDFLAGGEGDDSLFGGSSADELRGGAGNDLLDGGVGDDSMAGGTGDDVYVVDSAGDSIDEAAGDGTDEVRTTLAAYTLAAGLEKLTALGGQSQVLNGNGSDNVIDGGAGADTMAGRAGNDVYIVDDIGDVVVEAEGEGTDEIRTDLAYYSLAANVENLTGTRDSGQFLVGNASANLIKGGDSHDYLNGGLGADTMIGGSGSDQYWVDDVGDVVVELAGASGSDLIRTSLAVYSLLGTEVEMLLADSNVNHDFRGSAAGNHIAGAAGNDFFRMQDGGNDTALGGDGNDVFLFGAALTSADQVDGGSGTDQVAIQGDYSGAKALTLGSNLVSI